ncbi:hypothetical protein [Streptomyces huasconensis]|uniref:hypothetical protein n=1 Tax=Streptomyces huasconensis TaxID=1854574 RepID=UPI0033F06AA6
MKRSVRIVGGFTAAVTTGALLVGVAPSAMADDGLAADSRAAHVVERATGTSDLAATTTAPGAAAVAHTQADDGTVTATAPKDAAGAVEITAPDGTTASLGLPQDRATDGTQAGDGTVVYTDAAKDTDLAVQLTDDGGARALTTLKNAQAPTEQRYDLHLPAGTKAVANDTGGYDLLRKVDNDSFAMVVGAIDAPWAKDARGKSVPTNYKLEGDTLVQQVNTTKDTAFPVVADPKFTWGWVTGTAYFKRSETRSIAIYGATAALSVSMLPPPLNVLYRVNAALVTAKAASANSAKQCLKIKFAAGIFVPGSHKGGYCK